VCGGLALAATASTPAAAEFPYGVQGANNAFDEYRLADSDERPEELEDDIEWKFAASPEQGNEATSAVGARPAPAA